MKIKKSIEKSKSVTKWCRCGKCRVMVTNAKRLHYLEVEALEYFIILGITYECSLSKSLNLLVQ